MYWVDRSNSHYANTRDVPSKPIKPSTNMKPIFIPYRRELKWMYYWDPDNGETIAYSNINLQEYYAVRIDPIEKIIRHHL